jgi:Caudovirus prohead serine protease
MDEQTYRQAAALYDEQQLRLHESGHASAALLLGLEVSSIHTNGGHDGNTAPGETLIGYTSADHRDMALAILAGPLAEGRTAPRWPLAATTTDQQQLGEHVRELHLDESGYAELCDQARDLTASAPFKQLHASIVTALEQPPHNVGAAELRDLQRKALMQHKQLALAVVDTTEVGEGEMIALASTWELDKVGDQVMPGAYAQSVAKIKAGQRLPLIWGHDANGSPTNWVGEIDDADETPEGLKVHARFDLEDEAGRKAYRSLSKDASSP